MCSSIRALRGRRTPTVRSRRGVSIIFSVLIISLLIMFVSLAVDFGRIRLARAQLQTAADASARAGTWALPKSTQAVFDDAVYVASQNAVLDNSSSGNGRTNPGVELDLVEDIAFGQWRTVDGAKQFVEIADDATTTQDERRAANAVRTHARRLTERDNPVKLIFAPAVGVFSKDIEREAIAYITDGPSNFGFVGIDWVKSNGNKATVDSALYGTVGTGGGIASNGDIDLGNGDVYGDARSSTALIQNGNSIVTGWTAPLDYDLSDRYPPDTYSPLVSFTNSTSGFTPTTAYTIPNHTFSPNGNTNAAIASGTYHFKEWKHTGSGTVTVTGPATFYIDGDFKMTGGGTLKFDTAGGPVKFYCNGNFDQIGGNILNTGSAANLYISLTGAKTDLKFGGSVATAAHIYAPLSDVTITGTPGFTGWIIGKTLSFLGTSNLHYDETGDDNTQFKLHLVK